MPHGQPTNGKRDCRFKCLDDPRLGRITQEFTVWCALDCRCWWTLSCNGRKAVANGARAAGWRLKKGLGWVCPGCLAGPNESGVVRHDGCV